MTERITPWVVAAVIVAVCLIGVTAAVPVVADEAEAGERTIEKTELAPGETTAVTIEIEDSEEDSVGAIELLSPSPQAVEITDFDPTGGFRTTEQRDGETAVIFLFEDATSVTATYDVTVSDNATAGETITFSNEAYDLAGDDEIVVAGEDDTGGGNGSGGDDRDTGGGDDGTDGEQMDETEDGDTAASDDDDAASDETDDLPAEADDVNSDAADDTHEGDDSNETADESTGDDSPSESAADSDEQPDDDDSVPGFTVSAALLALLGTTLLATRQTNALK